MLILRDRAPPSQVRLGRECALMCVARRPSRAPHRQEHQRIVYGVVTYCTSSFRVILFSKGSYRYLRPLRTILIFRFCSISWKSGTGLVSIYTHKNRPCYTDIIHITLVKERMRLWITISLFRFLSGLSYHQLLRLVYGDL